MTIKDLLLSHLDTTFVKGPGQPSISVALEGLGATQAAWKVASERRSIWQIVQHLTRWKQAVWQDWHGSTPDYAAIDKGDWAEVSGTEAAWLADLEALQRISHQYRTFVEGLTPEDLERVVPGLGVPLAGSIMDMATHDIYHAGQIRYVRALQGA